MREIKFRGKRIDNEEWIIAPAFLTLKTNTESCTKMLDFRSDGKFEIETSEGNLFYLQATTIDLATIGQFTGLHDKNGKEIYEGDIVMGKYPMGCFGYDERKALYVGFKESCFKIMHKQEDDYEIVLSCASELGDIEIIGNIHDNPELLEVK